MTEPNLTDCFSPDQKSPLNDTNGQLMVLAAHRYCLGRQSYIVGSCIEWLKQWWVQFDRNTRNVIVRDTIGAIQMGETGSTFDNHEWRIFAEWAWRQIDEDDQRDCRQALAYRNKPWPLYETPTQSDKPDCGDDGEACGH